MNAPVARGASGVAYVNPIPGSIGVSAGVQRAENIHRSNIAHEIASTRGDPGRNFGEHVHLR